MKIVLNSDLAKVGRKGDIVEVAAGYARNYLLPRGLALAATKGAVRQAEHMQRARGEQERKERGVAEEMSAKIGAAPLRISARAGDEGQLFGSVTTAEIAEKLSEFLGEEVDRRKVTVPDAIRSVGVHGFTVHLHPEVNATGSVEVIAETG